MAAGRARQTPVNVPCREMWGRHRQHKAVRSGPREASRAAQPLKRRCIFRAPCRQLASQAAVYMARQAGYASAHVRSALMQRTHGLQLCTLSSHAGATGMPPCISPRTKQAK